MAQEQLERIDNSTSTIVDASLAKQNSKKWNAFVAPAICFAVALLVSLLNNLYGNESKIVLIFDSRHYLESARLMVLWWQESLAKGDFLAALNNLTNQQHWFGEYLILDGPVLPTMAAVVFAALGKVPQPTDWRVLIAMLSVLHATSSLLVCLLMRHWIGSNKIGSNKWALVAGISWALYPAAIVAASRFLTEEPAVTLLLASTYCLSVLVPRTNKSIAGPAFALGAIDGLMLLLKPVLLPIWGLAHCVAWFAWGWKKRLVVPAMIAAGLVVVFVPWLVTTKVVTGQLQLLPQRVPAYNFAKGCDVEADGWGAMPSPPLTEMFAAEKSIEGATMGVWTTRPMESLNLILRKTTRMWSWPWNDFRQRPLTLSMDWQRWWHWLICLGAAGGSFVFLSLSKPKDRIDNFVGFASLAIVLAHAVYLPFETINRYGFTTMPFMVMLAVFFIYSLARFGKLPKAILTLAVPTVFLGYLISFDFAPQLVAIGLDAVTAVSVQMAVTWLVSVWLMLSAISLTANLTPKSKHKTVFLLFVLGSVISGAVCTAFASDTKRIMSWSCSIQPGESVCRTIDLASSQLRSWGRTTGQYLGGALVLIDGDSSLKDAFVRVNGQLIADKPVSLTQFRPDSYWVLDTMRKYAGTIGFQLDDLKQWYAVSVPVSALHLSGGNIIVVSADKTPVTVFGEYRRGNEGQYPASLDNFSAGAFCNDGKLMDGRLSQPVTKRFVANVSSLESGRFGNYDDLSPALGKQTGEYHIYLAGLFKPDVTGNDMGIGPSSSRKLKASDFDPLLRLPQEGPTAISISKLQFQCIANNTVETCVPSNVTQGSHVIVTISGQMRSSGKTSQFSLLPVAVGGKKAPFITVLPHAPAKITAGPEWQEFEIREEIPIAAMQGALTKIQIGVYPGPWEQVSEYGVVGSYGQTILKDMSIKLTANNRKNFSGKVPAIF